MRTARRIARLAPGVTRAARTASPSFATAPTTRFNAPITPHRVLDTCFVDLDALKRIRYGVDGATVNDVALTIFGGALRAYLGEIGELPTAPLRAMTPVALRAKAGGNEIGNRLSAMVVSLASDVEDPLARLGVVAAGTRAAKDAAEAIGPAEMGDVLGLVPTAMIAPGARLASRMSRFGLPGAFNTVVSNVAGSPEVLYLAGARMIRSTGGGPVVDGLGLINYVTSYAGTAAFGFTACREQMPDPERYRGAILRSFDALRASVGV
jgi:WS/DGAT/MGAT family acyltransferase